MEIVYLDGQKVNIVEPICSAIGFFDGLHIGHMALVNEVKRVSEQKGYKKALMTFDHYPLYVLGKIKEEKYLTSMNDRISLLEKEGLDYLFIVKFTKEVAVLKILSINISLTFMSCMLFVGLISVLENTMLEIL